MVTIHLRKYPFNLGKEQQMKKIATIYTIIDLLKSTE